MAEYSCKMVVMHRIYKVCRKDCRYALSAGTAGMADATDSPEVGCVCKLSLRPVAVAASAAAQLVVGSGLILSPFSSMGWKKLCTAAMRPSASNSTTSVPMMKFFPSFTAVHSAMA